MNRNIRAITGVLMALAAGANFARAAAIFIPNHSFESPASTFVSVNVGSWQKTPKPDGYDESGGFLWTQLTGIFKNSATNSPHHIVNCDGVQAVWLFVVPEAGLFQDYDSVDLDDPAPSHAFDARYEVGKSYHLTVGIIGTGGGMQPGATLELSLYYRDDASNRVPVAFTTVTNLPTIFSNNTAFVDFTVNVPPVKSADAWAGRHIGIQFLSTVATNLQGGYWDLDNVRLVTGPTLSSPVKSDDTVEFQLFGQAGAVFEIFSTTNPILPMGEWSSLGTITNLTGTVPFVDTNAGFDQRFYRARQLP